MIWKCGLGLSSSSTWLLYRLEIDIEEDTYNRVPSPISRNNLQIAAYSLRASHHHQMLAAQAVKSNLSLDVSLNVSFRDLLC